MAQVANDISTWVTLAAESCCMCGVAFGMPVEFKEARLRDREDFYCPNGHGQHYLGETQEARLRRSLEQATARADEAEVCRDVARRRLAATRGVLTRTKNKIAAGTCPCCKKAFKVLAKHMASAHPEFATTDETGTP